LSSNPIPLNQASPPSPGFSASLKKRVLAASSWVLAAYVGAIVLRFVSNVILTHLLFPEAFGSMVVVVSVTTGVALLSDLGLHGGIIVHHDGADERYMNTAWTIQIIRGVVMGALIFLAAKPLALAFSNVALTPLLRIVSLSPIIYGFMTTKVALADRQLNPKRKVKLDFGLQLTSLAITAVLAWVLRSTEALAWGMVASSLLSVVVQHLFLHGPPNRLAWDRLQARKIFSIGQITLFSSALTYASGEGGRLFSATMLDSRMLGIIGLASALSAMPWQAVQNLSGQVLMPAYSEVVRSGDTSRLRRVILKARLLQIVPCWVLNVAMLLLAGVFFHVFYDSRYAQGAEVLRLQCVGMLVAVLANSYGGVLWSMGKMRLSLALQVFQIAILWAGMYLGFRLDGPMGLVIGTSLAAWAFYPVAFLVYRRLGLSNGWFDSAVLALSAMATFLLWQSHGA
jgi:O-antigen/teichoic acid export membrane protein